MIFEKFETFGLMKTLVDAHTMGVHTAAALLRDCGYRVIVAPLDIEAALDKIISESEQRKILKWIKENRITRISFSYRLDSERAVDLMGRLVHVLKVNGYYGTVGAQVRSICFAGLKNLLVIESIRNMKDIFVHFRAENQQKRHCSLWEFHQKRF